MNTKWIVTAASVTMLSVFLVALPTVRTTEAYFTGTATGQISFSVGQFPVDPPVEPTDPDIPAECGPVSNYDQVIKVAIAELLLGYDLSGNDIIILTAAFPGGWLDGKEGNDCIVGNNGTDRLIGGPGDDILIGRGGNDILEDHDGSNTMYGGAGTDSCLGVATKFECENPPSLTGGTSTGDANDPSSTGDDAGPAEGTCLPVRGRPVQC